VGLPVAAEDPDHAHGRLGATLYDQRVERPMRMSQWRDEDTDERRPSVFRGAQRSVATLQTERRLSHQYAI
jgi:hypothetical protein